MTRHLVAHDLGLLGNLARKFCFVALRFVGEHAQRRFQRMGQVANLRAGPVNDFRIGMNEQVQLIGHRLQFAGEFTLQALGLAAANGTQGLLHALHGLQCHAHLQEN